MIAWIWTCAIVGVAAFLWIAMRKDPRLEYLGNMIPGPGPWPLIGNALDLPRTARGNFPFREKCTEQYGDVSRIWVGTQLVIFLNNPKDIEAVMKDPQQTKKGQVYDFTKNFLGKGLLTSGGDLWAAKRKCLTRAFHFKILDQFMEIFNKQATALVAVLKAKQLPAEIDVMEHVRQAFVNIICETAMGISSDNLPKIEEYSEQIQALSELIMDRVMNAHQYIDVIWWLTGGHATEMKCVKKLNKLSIKIIQEKEAEILARSTGNNETCLDDYSSMGIKKKTAFLEMLIKMKLEGNPTIKTNRDIMDETNTFFFAGHDTTSTATCFTLEMLARHPLIQEELYREFKHNICNPEVLTADDLQNLPLLERFLKESLRLYPPVPAIAKQLARDVQLPSGYTLPKDSLVSPSIFHAQRHSDFYDNPEEFNPDNFLPENVAKRHPFAFIPFSAGPRNCIGQKFAMLELKIMISQIVCNFRVSLPDQAKETLSVYPSITLKKTDGHKLVLHNR